MRFGPASVRGYPVDNPARTHPGNTGFSLHFGFPTGSLQIG